VTKTTKKVANGVLSGVVRVSGFLTSSVVNSKAGKKVSNLLPGEMVSASLDGFSMLSYLIVFLDLISCLGCNIISLMLPRLK